MFAVPHVPCATNDHPVVGIFSKPIQRSTIGWYLVRSNQRSPIMAGILPNQTNGQLGQPNQRSTWPIKPTVNIGIWRINQQPNRWLVTSPVIKKTVNLANRTTTGQHWNLAKTTNGQTIGCYLVQSATVSRRSLVGTWPINYSRPTTCRQKYQKIILFRLVKAYFVLVYTGFSVGGRQSRGQTAVS